jgi:hypothetical protein
MLILLFVAIGAGRAQEASAPSREAARVFEVLEPPRSARLACCRIVRLDDSGYIAVGSVQYLDGRSRGWAALLDSSCGRLWEKQWSFENPFSGLADGVSAGTGFAYLVGHSGHPEREGGPRSSAVVIKIDTRGNTVWTRMLPFSADARAEAVTIARDGTVVVAGQTRRQSSTTKSLFVVALDATGVVLWERVLLQADDIYGTRMYPTQSGGYLLGGSFGLLRLDAAGAVLWRRRAGDVAAFLETGDGRVVSIANTSGAALFAEFGPHGEATMEKTLEGTCFIIGGWMSIAGDITVAEQRCSEDRGHWISTLSRSGVRQSSSRVGIPDNANPLELGPDSGAGVVGAGMFQQDGAGALKAWFFRGSGVAVTK